MGRPNKKPSQQPLDAFGNPSKKTKQEEEETQKEETTEREKDHPIIREEESTPPIEDSCDVYGELLKKKKKEIKVTFELDEEVVKLINRLATKFPHGFKKTFANNAIKNEAKRVAESHNIKL